MWMAPSLRSAVALCAALAGIATCSATAFAQSDGLVISQVYGGGGASGSTFNRDYVELFNRGTMPVSTAGWSLQSQFSGSSAWSNKINLPAASIDPGRYFLIGIGPAGSVAGTGAGLPAVDAQTTDFSLGFAIGKVALVGGTSLLPDGVCSDPMIVDLVQYGTATVVCAEGAATGALTITTAAFRDFGGCQDTNNNAADFHIAQTAPRNSATTAAPCAPAIETLTLSPGLSGGPNYLMGDVVTVTVSLADAPPSGMPASVEIDSGAFAPPVQIDIAFPQTQNSTTATMANPGSYSATATPIANCSGSATFGPFGVIFTPPCLADVSHNHVVDVDDLLAVISGWGPCAAPCPPHCAADIAPIAPASGNCAVDVDDLLVVITHWGPCPP